MTRNSWIIAGVLVALIAAAVTFAAIVGRDDTTTGAQSDATPMFDFAAAGAPWEGAPTRTGQLSGPGVTVGRVTIAPPVPTGFNGDFDVEALNGVTALRATGQLGESEAAFEWWFPANNPHSAFAGQWTATVSALRESPPVSSIHLPAGELTYVNAAYETVPFAGTEVVIPGIASGPIVWRSGGETVSLWQWTADRVTVSEAEQGGIRIDFAWWHPEHHQIPEDCDAEVAELPLSIRTGLAISFDSVIPATVGRLADGATGAAVPIFFDPQEIDDPRYRDGASTSASDFLSRARTVALGHSDPGDARHGNGGLAGTGVGGTILVPQRYAEEMAQFEELTAALEEATVEFARESDLVPTDCADWAKKWSEDVALLGLSTTFDGAFPNLLAAGALGSAPAGDTAAFVWPSVELTGRRKEVVQQTLSHTYLDRLEKKRGIAILRIPLVATRNPLVAAAAESLLEPERQGNWTIQENVSRALAEIELLAEERNFALSSLFHLSRHLADVASVRRVVTADGALELHNPAAEPITGYTLVVDGSVVPVLGDASPVSHEVRDVPGGRQQTWVWFDLPAGKTKLRLERPDAPAASLIAWKLPE